MRLRLLASFVVACGLAVAAGCNSQTKQPTPASCSAGQEACSCLANGLCQAPFVCRDAVCSAATDSSGGAPASSGAGAGMNGSQSGQPATGGQAMTSGGTSGGSGAAEAGGAPSGGAEAGTGGVAGTSAGMNAGGCGATATDPNNCGSCGTVCQGACMGGKCAETPPIVAGAADAYPYVSDLGNGTYRNPLLVADYSDPDVLRVGSDYYLVASSFNQTPGLPILHSRDLVNWRLVGHALENLSGARFASPQNGQGVWAPSIREHAGTYYIAYPNYCKPADGGACAEEGIWVVTATSPTGPWTEPHQLLAARGVIDPCLFWDDDGKAYLVHAYANSRAGISDRLDIRPISVDAKQMLGTGQMVFSNPTKHPTLEGPKLYKHDGWYLILAPAGGVVNGWQLALRSKTIYGPYEDRIVLEQGTTNVNGPHQGGMIDTPTGSEYWFLHFQDAGVYGRILHLNPVTWENDWPLMGKAGTGSVREPVTTFKKPALPVQPVAIPQTSDDFASSTLSLAWQWSANHQASFYSLTARPGYLRLMPQTVSGGDITLAPNLLMQKLPARSFEFETTVELSGTKPGTRAGLVMWGDPPTSLTVEDLGTRVQVQLITNGTATAGGDVARGPVKLTIVFRTNAATSYSYEDSAGKRGSFQQAITMVARKGSWIGAKAGIFAIASATGETGHADFDAFTFTPHTP